MIKTDEFINSIYRMEEVKPQIESEFTQLLGIVSGNKDYLEKATLGDVLYLLDNLEKILDDELQIHYPKIDLDSLQGCNATMRRAV